MYRISFFLMLLISCNSINEITKLNKFIDRNNDCANIELYKVLNERRENNIYNMISFLESDTLYIMNTYRDQSGVFYESIWSKNHTKYFYYKYNYNETQILSQNDIFEQVFYDLTEVNNQGLANEMVNRHNALLGGSMIHGYKIALRNKKPIWFSCISFPMFSTFVPDHLKD